MTLKSKSLDQRGLPREIYVLEISERSSWTNSRQMLEKNGNSKSDCLPQTLWLGGTCFTHVMPSASASIY